MKGRLRGVGETEWIETILGEGTLGKAKGCIGTHPLIKKSPENEAGNLVRDQGQAKGA